jgi:hypothetical protein
MFKAFRKIRKRYEWPSKKRDFEKYVKPCKSCQLNKNLVPYRRYPRKSRPRLDNPSRDAHSI